MKGRSTNGRHSDLIVKVGPIPPVLTADALLNTQVELIDGASSRSRPIGNYSLKDLLIKLI
jgi:hypothetical protein